MEIKGEKYEVKISYPEHNTNTKKVPGPNENGSSDNIAVYITSPLEGKFFLTKDSAELGIKVGDTIKKGDTVAYVEAMKVINAITSDYSGVVAEILVAKGADVEEDQNLIKLI